VTDIAGNSSTRSGIGVGGTVTSILESAGDHDWFQISLSAGQSITMALTGVGSDPVDDTYLIIRNASGNQLAFNDDGGAERNSLLSFTATSAGTYYIDVSAWSDPAQGYYGDTGGYQLSVRDYVPPPVFNNDQIADQLVNGFWENNGGSARHFNVREGGTITVNITGLTSDGQFLARHALELWSDSLGIRFAETTGSAQITFDDDDGDASDDAAFSTSVTSGSYIVSSDVNIDVGWVSNYGTSLNSYSFQTYLHEIGHALGLGHAGNYNGTADYPTDALYQNDAWSTTVMSYFSQPQNSYFAERGFTYDYAVTPMVADLVALSSLYGTPTTTRTEDTVYGFNSNADREVFDASTNPNVAYTIVDSGGIDTLDYSGFATAQSINLTAETFSNVGASVGNVSIARGTVIENAIGGRGNDILTGNSANNILTGGGGNDTVSYAEANGLVVVDLNIATLQNTRAAGFDTLRSIENVIGSNFSDVLTGNASANQLSGNDGNDYLFGQAGDDRLAGGDGNDRFYGGAGNDVMSGGNGFDTAFYTDAAAAVTIDLSITAAQNTGGAGTDTLSGIELVNGSRYDDTISGDSEKNVISGYRGNDLLHGGGGDDRLNGESDSDTLFGDAGNDRLIGRTGDDVLRGGDGSDRLYGDEGNDVLDGGAGYDMANYLAAAAAVTVNLASTGRQNTGGGGTDTLTGIERIIGSAFDDRITGSSGAERLDGGNGNDVVSGGGGADILVGQNGNDIIDGGGGRDWLYGGSGDDVFRFDTTLVGSADWDVIGDFSAADDTIELSQSIFTKLAAIETLAASAFHVGTEAEDSFDRIIYDQRHGRIFYDSDGDGAASQVLFARVTPGTALDSGDFSVIGSAAAESSSTKAAMDAFAAEPMSTEVSVDAAHIDYLLS